MPFHSFCYLLISPKLFLLLKQCSSPEPRYLAISSPVRWQLSNNYIIQDEMRENMGKGMASFGPTMTLDAVLKMLLISIGTISGIWCVMIYL